MPPTGSVTTSNGQPGPVSCAVASAAVGMPGTVPERCEQRSSHAGFTPPGTIVRAGGTICGAPCHRSERGEGHVRPPTTALACVAVCDVDRRGGHLRVGRGAGDRWGDDRRGPVPPPTTDDHDHNHDDYHDHDDDTVVHHVDVADHRH